MADKGKQRLQIEFGLLNEKNIGQFQKINLETLPTVYSSHFYQLVLGPARYTRLAFHNDLTIGAISCKYDQDNGVDCMYIMTIGVLPSYQRMGVAEQLLRKAMSEFMMANKMTRCILHVQESNVAAVNFYLKMGFTQIERLENFYTQPSVVPPHALKMGLTINK